MKRQFYKVSEVAKMLGFKDTGSVRKRIRDGRLKAIKNDGDNGHYLIPVDEYEKYLKSLDV